RFLFPSCSNTNPPRNPIPGFLLFLSRPRPRPQPPSPCASRGSRVCSRPPLARRLRTSSTPRATDSDAMLLGCRSLSTWVRRLVACMGSCLGCCGCAKPAPIIAVDEPSKGLRIQGRSVRKANLSEDFWSTSVHKIENSAVQSQRSISSMSPALQSSDQHGDGSSSNPNEFVNQGLMQWNQTRQQWLGNKKFNFRPEKPREPKLRKW
ncbi:hypothetical protein BRADI_1g36550v3, partial [Brachypodium distachyon]